MKKLGARGLIVGGLAASLLAYLCVFPPVSKEENGSNEEGSGLSSGYQPAYFTSAQEDPDAHIKEGRFYPLIRRTAFDSQGKPITYFPISRYGELRMFQPGSKGYGLVEKFNSGDLIQENEGREIAEQLELNFLPRYSISTKKQRKKQVDGRSDALWNVNVGAGLDTDKSELVWKYCFYGNTALKKFWEENNLVAETSGVRPTVGDPHGRVARIIDVKTNNALEKNSYSVEIIVSGENFNLKKAGSTNSIYSVTPLTEEELKTVRL